jgi:hypothetical protein
MDKVYKIYWCDGMLSFKVRQLFFQDNYSWHHQNKNSYPEKIIAVL